MDTTPVKTTTYAPCGCKACSTGNRGGRIHDRVAHASWVVDGTPFRLKREAVAYIARRDNR